MSILIIADAEQIVTPVSDKLPQRGKEMGEVRVYKKGSMALDSRTGKILSIGPYKKVKRPKARVIEAKSRVVLPGFVDSHTHPIYAGSRVNEFLQRAQGKNYMEILESGGGILSTVSSTRKASGEVLFNRARTVFRGMLKHGTTTVEAKSGYGLSTSQEIRHLKILKKLREALPIEIYTTFLGAHAAPPEYRDNRDGYVELVCSKMIPRVAEEKLADFCDVFCERGIFEVEESRGILETALRFGMRPRLHADEFESIGGAEFGVSMNALSVDHLMGISETGIKALSASDTAAVLLPCTSFFLGKDRYAPARRLIDSGAVVALATDFNAGSNMCYSMQMALSIGLLQMKMTPEEVLVAGTLHGAHALGIADRAGSLHPGKQADLILLPGEDYREVFYRYGTNQVSNVIKRGKVVNT